MSIRQQFLSGVLVTVGLLMSSLVLSDPAPPYDFNCIEKIEHWDQVKGKWRIENGELKVEPAAFDKVAILSAKALKIPSWYQIRLKVRGFELAQKRWIGIIVGYKDEKNYWLCSVEQRVKNQSIVQLSQAVNGKRKMTVSVPIESKARDTVVLSTEVHSKMSTISVAIEGHYVMTYACDETLPRRVGVSLKSANVAITHCSISGVAKK